MKVLNIDGYLWSYGGTQKSWIGKTRKEQNDQPRVLHL